MKAKVFTLASFSPRPGLYFISLAANSPYLAFSLFHKLLSPLRYPHFLHLPFPPFQGFPQGVFLLPVSLFVLPPALKFRLRLELQKRPFSHFHTKLMLCELAGIQMLEDRASGPSGEPRRMLAGPA